MNNYPPGVTGNEFAISGPTEEWVETRECDQCDRETEHECWYHPTEGAWAECTVCGIEHDITEEYNSEPDPDSYQDWMREEAEERRRDPDRYA